MSPVIQTSELFVRLGSNDVLRGVSAKVAAGVMVGLIGPNGSGKTTLLRTLAGLLPYRGSALLTNREVRNWPRRDLARRLAFVRQFHALTFDFTVEELVLLGRTPHKRLMEGYGPSDVSRTETALAEMEVSGFRRRSIQQLSGGELQRVLLAQALVQEADVLLLDEPTAHLDVHHQFSFLSAVRRQVSANRTVVAVFHDLALAARFADELIVLHEGSVFANGPPNDVITPDLLASVFRMDARIEAGPEGDLRIGYLDTVNHSTRTSRPPTS